MPVPDRAGPVLDRAGPCLTGAGPDFHVHPHASASRRTASDEDIAQAMLAGALAQRLALWSVLDRDGKALDRAGLVMDQIYRQVRDSSQLRTGSRCSSLHLCRAARLFPARGGDGLKWPTSGTIPKQGAKAPKRFSQLNSRPCSAACGGAATHLSRTQPACRARAQACRPTCSRPTRVRRLRGQLQGL